MSSPELDRLTLLAEVDQLVSEMRDWAGGGPDWTPARAAGRLIQRLLERADPLRVRLSAPLVVAVLGGTGTGKSTLINALVGADVTASGRERPTTRRPVFVAQRELRPEEVGLDPESVQRIENGSPLLADMALVDCPDPDTTESGEGPSSNLARLRAILPRCDVIVITATQQKYRSARVHDELLAASAGARLVFVQTHADRDVDIREDWRSILGPEFSPGEIFFVDSRAALADQQGGLAPRGEFGRLVAHLTRELAGSARHRIRRANFLDLSRETVQRCEAGLEAAWPRVEALEAAVHEQRARLAKLFSSRLRDELLVSRRTWESRLVGEVAGRWGYSPFSLVLRLANGAGSLLSGAALLRARSGAQLALWGAFEGARAWKKRGEERQADGAAERALVSFVDESELRTAAIIVDGYVNEAGFSRDPAADSCDAQPLAAAAKEFAVTAASETQQTLNRLAGRHAGWFTRMRYELLLGLALAVVLYRWGRNFLWDSWLAAELGYSTTPSTLLGSDFWLSAGFWTLLWSALLLFLFSRRLRRGLRQEIDALCERLAGPTVMASPFRREEEFCRRAAKFRDGRQRLAEKIETLRRRVAGDGGSLGRRIDPLPERAVPDRAAS